MAMTISSTAITVNKMLALISKDLPFLKYIYHTKNYVNCQDRRKLIQDKDMKNIKDTLLFFILSSKIVAKGNQNKRK